MGLENESEKTNGIFKGKERISKAYLVVMLLLSLMISTAGGFMFGWWLHKFHPTNSKLWMVPFGLILFLAPLIIWFFLIISEICVSKSQKEEDTEMNQRVLHPAKESVYDPRR